MKPLAARLTRGLNLGSLVISSDNSGAALVRITGIKHGKGRRGRQMSAALGDWVKVSVRKGLPEMKGKVFDAIVIRQRMPYRRNTGERICFTDNAVVLLKDEKLGRLAAKILDRLDDLSANVEDNIIKTLNPKFQIAYKGKFAGTN